MRFFIVVLVILVATVVVTDYLLELRERTVILETYDDAEAKKFMDDCDGFVRVYTRALKHTVICHKKKEDKT